MSGKVEPDDYGGPDGGKRDRLTPEEREAAAKLAPLFQAGAEADAKRKGEKEEDKKPQRVALRNRPPVQPMADGGVVQQPDAGIQKDAFSRAIAEASAAGRPVEIQSPDGTLARFGKTDAGTPPMAGAMAPEPIQAAPVGGGDPYFSAMASGVGDVLGAGVDALKQAPAALMQMTGQAAAPPPPPQPIREQNPETLQALATMPAAAPALPAEAPPTPSVSPQPGGGLPVGSGTRKEFDAGVEQQLAGLEALAQMQATRDAAVVEQQDRFIAERQALQATFEANLADQQRRADDMAAAIAADKIDPQRIWNSASVGQRVTAGIGILLSGLGQGLAGGPNLALQQIQRTIDLDIDAQKENLQTKKGLLSFYLQQGKDMISAYGLAKADLQDVYAAQALRVAAQFGGKEAVARAQMAAGELRQGASLKRQEIMGRDYALAGQRLALQQQQAAGRLNSMFAAAPAAPGGGLQLTAGMREMLPKEKRERLVRLPKGGWTFATTKEEAAQVNKSSVAFKNIMADIAPYMKILKSGSPVLPAVLEGDREKANTLKSSLTLKLKEFYGLGALQQGEIDLIDRLLPEITNLSPSSGQAAAIRTLVETLESGYSASLSTRLGL